MFSNRHYYTFLALYLGGLLLLILLSGGAVAIQMNRLFNLHTPMLYELPNMRVTIANQTKSNYTARLTLQLHVTKGDEKLLELYQPLISDRVNSYVATLSAAELKAPRTATWLRHELFMQIKQVSGPVNIRGVSIKDLRVL
jgi:flagellar basal body-associated protein FliL